MKKEYSLKDWHLNAGVSNDIICDIVSPIGRKLPTDYEQFLREHDGGEGFISSNYLILWKAEQLNAFNREYEVERYAPGLFLFGSDGGGEGYAFDARDVTMPVVRVPFIGMELRYANLIAASFTDLLAQLAK